MEKRFNEMKDLFPDLDAFKAYMETHKEFGNLYLDWAMVMNDIFII